MFVATSMHSTMGKGAARRWRALWLAWVVVAWAAQPSLAQRLIWLGTLPGGFWSDAYGVSADGSVVVGYAQNAAGQWSAFRWTAAGGMQDLGTLGGRESKALGVSADGSVVVGWAYSVGQHRAFRWTAASGMQDLGTLGGWGSAAYGVSADGSVVVGVAQNAAGKGRAFRWTEAGGMQDLGTLGGDRSEAYGVSADGSVVVGVAQNAAGKGRAFRWTEAGGMQDLGTLPGGCCSSAYGVSADGSVVVGVAWNDAGDRRAFRWTEASGMQDLGTLGGRWSAAYGVSADGSVVVGRALNAAFRWTAAGGMEDLNITYAHLLTNRLVLEVASAISPDGRYIVGRGYNAAIGRPEAYLLDTQGTGVEEWLGAARVRLRLLPQPAHERVALELEAAEAAGRVTIVVSDVLGRVVAEPLRGAALPPGVQQRNRAFRWTAASGMQDLGTLPGGCCSSAYGVSADGSVVVGWARNAAGQDRAFRWTAVGGMQDLGTLGGGESRAFGVSADGSVVVGWAENAAGQTRAFRWTAAGGMEDLNTTYAHLLTNGSELRIAYAVSPDGRYIVGSGYNAVTERFEAFLLDTQGTGVEERSGAARVRLRLLPQPAHERVVLELEAAEAAGRVTIVVSDVLGRVVAEPLCGAALPPGVQQRIELDVRAWAAGQYTVVLRTEAGSTAVPLVVVR